MSTNRKLKERASSPKVATDPGANLPDVLGAIVDAPIPVVAFSRDGLARLWNEAAGRLLGWSRDEVVDHPIANVFPSLLSGDGLATVPVWEGQPGRRKDGTTIHVTMATWPFRDLRGEVIGAVGIIQEVALSPDAGDLDVHRRLEVILDAIPCPIFYKDENGVYVGCNIAFEKYLGKSRHEILGKGVFEIAPPELAKVYKAADDDLFQKGGVQIYEAGVVYADGAKHDVMFNKAVFHKQDGSLGGLVGTMLDITARKQAERALEHLAFHDPLTGLPNRALFMDHLKRSLAHSRRHHETGAVVFIDLDRFKWVNDSLGHEVGDALLKTVASRLRGCLRESDTLARFGGDEFIALLPGIGEGTSGAITVAERMLAELSEPLLWQGQEVHVSASIGISVYPRDTDDASTLLRRADAAMYQAKQGGRNAYKLYAPGEGNPANEELRIESELHHALDRHELRLYLQPIWSLPARSLAGFEALVKWEHPRLGLLSASDFVPLAEQAGLIGSLSAWILREACRSAHGWHESGLDPGVLSVNVSATQFHRGDLVSTVTQALADSGLAPSRLMLELTESTIMPDQAESARQFERLRQVGVRVAIDDFGTGYSNLNALRRLPIDQLKLDRSFIEDLARPDGSRALVQAMVSLARGLSMDLVAEGVESTLQLEALEQLGCPFAQGYFLGLPLPAGSVADWLKRGQSRAGVKPAAAHV